MNSAHAVVDTYRKQQIMTASPGQLVLLLYSSARTRLRRALTSLAAGDAKSATDQLARVQDIVTELMVTLDPKGGAISDNLFRLYEYMTFRLVNARVRPDPAPIQEVSKLMAVLHEAWEQAVQRTGTAGQNGRPEVGELA
jgi:flagellar protein FliS